MAKLLRRFALIAGGCALTVLGMVGLVIPIIPGVLFLAGAVICFSMVSTGFRDSVGIHLFQHPRYRLARRRWNAGAGLPLLERFKLTFWTSLAALTPGPLARKG